MGSAGHGMGSLSLSLKWSCAWRHRSMQSSLLLRDILSTAEIRDMGKISTGAGAAFQGGSPKAQRLSQAGMRRGRATTTARSLRSTPLPDILHKWCGQEAEQWGSVLPRPLIGPANGLLSSSTTRQATGWEGTLPTYDLLEEASCSEEAQRSSEKLGGSSKKLGGSSKKLGGSSK